MCSKRPSKTRLLCTLETHKNEKIPRKSHDSISKTKLLSNSAHQNEIFWKICRETSRKIGRSTQKFTSSPEVKLEQNLQPAAKRYQHWMQNRYNRHVKVFTTKLYILISGGYIYLNIFLLEQFLLEHINN